MEAIFVILNTGAWDERLRGELTSQLDSLAAISTIASLIVSPGYIIDLSTLNTLIDCEEVKDRTEALYLHAVLPADPWVAESLRRFRMTLAGRNPTFASDEVDEDL